MLTINQYFDGKVASIGLKIGLKTGVKTDHLPATVGVMDIGEYQFDTAQHEVMTVISGLLSVQLPDTDDYKDYVEGESFEVAANKTFVLKVPVQTAYFCTYENK